MSKCRVIGAVLATLLAFPANVCASHQSKMVTHACSLDSPQACNSIDQLQEDPRFYSRLKTFLGHRQAHFSAGKNRPIVDDVLPFLSGPQQRVDRLGIDTRLTGCIWHACTHRGALVIAPGGRIIAVGILYEDFDSERQATHAYDQYRLQVYADRKALEHKAVVNNLTEWARKLVSSYATRVPMKFLRSVDSST